MTALADVFARLTTDPEFADEIRRDPESALSEFDLNDDERRRVAIAIGGLESPGVI